MFLFYSDFTFIILESFSVIIYNPIFVELLLGLQSSAIRINLSCPVIQIYLICILKGTLLCDINKITEKRTPEAYPFWQKQSRLTFNQKLIANKSCLIKKKKKKPKHVDLGILIFKGQILQNQFLKVSKQANKQQQQIQGRGKSLIFIVAIL